MWELGIVAGVAFVPVYLHRTACDSDNLAYKAAVYIINLFLVGVLLRIVTLIATLNDATIANTVNYIYIAYMYAAVFLLFLFIVILIRTVLSGKTEA